MTNIIRNRQRITEHTQGGYPYVTVERLPDLEITHHDVNGFDCVKVRELEVAA